MPRTPRERAALPDLASPLLRWYRTAARDLPWRRTRDPYAIWLSEAMLQQTQVNTVLPYYARFLDRFPTVRALADAPLADVLRLWAGLGYYARARNLHAAARQIVARHAGRLPDTVAALRTLPGVGRYTAGAVASIAYGRRAPLVDGNVRRVLSRLFAIRTPAAGIDERLWILAESLLPPRRCGDFNQALMELGATLCTPTAPRCDLCPLARLCRARQSGAPERFPRPAPRAAVRAQTHAVAAVESRGRFLFVRRPEAGLWGGLWELPSAPANGHSARAAAQALLPVLVRPTPPLNPRPTARLTRQLTHRRVQFVIYSARAADRAAALRGQWRKLDDLADLGLSAAMHAVVARLAAPRRRAQTGPAHG